MKKVVLVASLLILALALLLGGCGKSSEGDKFLGTWKNASTGELLKESYYIITKVENGDNAYKIHYVLFSDQGRANTNKKGMITVYEKNYLATYKDGILSINGGDQLTLENNELHVDSYKFSWTKISDKAMDIKELDNGRGFVK